jgi:hypothetical protein
MRLTTRDRVATVVVAAAVVVAAGWFLSLPGARSMDLRAVTIVVLALGMPVSAAAVVPGFSGLIHGSRAYLFGASALGLVAFALAALTLANGTEETLAAMVVAMVVLWAMSTVRHSRMIGQPGRAHS